MGENGFAHQPNLIELCNLKKSTVESTQMEVKRNKQKFMRWLWVDTNGDKEENLMMEEEEHKLSTRTGGTLSWSSMRKRKDII